MVCAKGLDSKSKPTIKNAPLAHFLLLIQYKIFSIIVLRMRKFLAAFLLLWVFALPVWAAIPVKNAFSSSWVGNTCDDLDQFSQPTVDTIEKFRCCDFDVDVQTWQTCDGGSFWDYEITLDTSGVVNVGDTPKEVVSTKCLGCPSGYTDTLVNIFGVTIPACDITGCAQDCSKTCTTCAVNTTKGETPEYLAEDKRNTNPDNSHWVATNAYAQPKKDGDIVLYPTCEYDWECNAPTGDECSGSDFTVRSYQNSIKVGNKYRCAALSYTHYCVPTRVKCTSDSLKAVDANASSGEGYRIFDSSLSGSTNDGCNIKGMYGDCALTKCNTDYHIDPTTVKNYKCDPAGTACENNTQTCSTFLGNCKVEMNNPLNKVSGTISSGSLTWVGGANATQSDSWTTNCTCTVTTGGNISGRDNVIRGYYKKVGTYVGGRGEGTTWNFTERLTGCAAGYKPKSDGTVDCVPVDDGEYSADNNTGATTCPDGHPGEMNIKKYWNHSADKDASGKPSTCTGRNDMSCCYANCNESGYIPTDTNGQWTVKAGTNAIVYRNNKCQYKLSCKANYYNSKLANAQNHKDYECVKCPDAYPYSDTNSTEHPNTSSDGCYNTCKAQADDKNSNVEHGSWKANNPEAKIYNGGACATYLVCDRGYYSDGNTGTECHACPAGSTTLNERATAASDCVMVGGAGGTQFCDKHGCFNLPDNVTIPFAG